MPNVQCTRRALVSAIALLVSVASASGRARAEDRPATASPPPAITARPESAAPEKKEPPWYERIRLRGYTQIRYNRIGATNPHLKNAQGDKSIGDPNGLFIRRARLVFQSDVTSFLSIYLQPDFASAIQEAQNFGQMRDWYADIFLDKEKMFRIRAGQSKVPYGWELMQSSSNRLPFDRSDGMNSAFLNERDIGGYLMFETPAVRRRFKHLVDSGLKGSGDFGMVTVGILNGQPLNTRERNDNKHFVARLAYPFDVGSQTIEVAAGGYTGRFVPSRANEVGGEKEIADLRFHGTFVLYPKPFGLQVEYNAGYGPERVESSIEKRPLDGGYAMLLWRQKTPVGYMTPYARVHRYDGGKKFEQNSPRHEIRELNVGLEWQIQKWIELTTEFMASERTVDGKRQEGRLLRLQLQFNY